jgi:phenylpyruvate tautomerase PptA (4-oxalocrotonate tautomerase family)
VVFSIAVTVLAAIGGVAGAVTRTAAKAAPVESTLDAAPEVVSMPAMAGPQTVDPQPLWCLPTKERNRMPTYTCRSTVDTNSTAARPRIARAITEIHHEVAVAARFSVQVLFHDLAPESLYVGGRPAPVGHVWIRETPREEIWVSINDVPARTLPSTDSWVRTPARKAVVRGATGRVSAKAGGPGVTTFYLIGVRTAAQMGEPSPDTSASAGSLPLVPAPVKLVPGGLRRGSAVSVSGSTASSWIGSRSYPIPGPRSPRCCRR